jgi:hypothetical protein
LSILFLLVALFDYSLYRLNTYNLTLGVAGLLLLTAVWYQEHSLRSFISRLAAALRRGRWQVVVTPGALLFAAALALAAFYRYYRLELVPPEMVSDQAEKLMDIWETMNGRRYPNLWHRFFVSKYEDRHSHRRDAHSALHLLTGQRD